MDRKRVLIFPAGSEISSEIVNALKYSKFVELIGGTSIDDHSEFMFREIIRGFPYVNDKNFLAFLNTKIAEYRIDCVYPAHDSVSVFLSEHAHEIPAQVIITDEFTTKTCRSKTAAYRLFAGEDFIPRTYSSADEVDAFPVFVKPDVGQGSQGAMKISSREELVNALKHDPSLIICEYLPGMEYTVDCFTDGEGVLRVVKLRDRERIKTGISVRSTSLNTDARVREIAAKINSRLHFRGAWFFQLKRSTKDEYMLMEISPRIPGTMGVSRNSGTNFPMLTLYVFCGMGGGGLSLIDNNIDITLDRAFHSAYKTSVNYEHVYVDYDDTLIVNGRVNLQLLTFLYQAAENGKHIYLLSKHIGDIHEDLRHYRISPDIFEQIIIISHQEHKPDFIQHKPAIFIDDSFAERKRVRDAHNIPVYDLDMVESLIDWRI